MKIPEKLKKSIPEPIKEILRPIQKRFVDKTTSELSFWRSRLKIDKGIFKDSYYQRYMLAMAEEPDDDFLKEKIVADFGCGPGGSLVWASSASLRIGIDILADRYFDEFTDNIISHKMIYLKSTEKVIPLPSDFVDVMFTLNAMDHVDSFSDMCSEIIRVLKPGGDLSAASTLKNLPQYASPKGLTRK